MFHSLAVAMWLARSRRYSKVSPAMASVDRITAPATGKKPYRRAAFKWEGVVIRRLIAISQLAGFFWEHDGDAVADGVSQTRRAADKLALFTIVFQHAVGHRTDQDLQQSRIDLNTGTFGGCCRGRDLGFSHGRQSYCTE